MNGRFAGHDDRECGEHRTTGGRAWCLNDQEWCSPEIPCRGCELPAIRQRAEKAEAVITRVRRLCEITIASSCRVQAVDQARDTLTILDLPEESR